MQREWMGRAALGMAAGIWGSMYVVSKVVLEVVPAMSLVWLRYLVAAFALYLLGRWQGVSFQIGKKEWPLVAGVGIIGYFISIWAQFAGTAASSAHLGAVITSTVPVFVVLLARVILGEHLTGRKLLAVGMATLGMFIIVGWPGVKTTGHLFWGEMLLVLAAVTWAWMSIMVKQIPRSYSTLAITFWGSLLAFICSSPFVFTQWHGGLWFSEVTAAIGWGVVYIGLVSTAGAFYLWNLGLAWTKEGTDSVYFFFQPIVGSLMGWMLLGEQLTLSFWLGGFFVLIGIGLSNFHRQGRSPNKKSPNAI